MQSTTTRARTVWRRAAAPLIGVVITGLALSACAPPSDGGDGEAITLDFWNGFTGPDQPVLESIIDEFNASQDRIVVENNPQPWDVIYDKALTAMTTDEGPDILALPSERLPQFAAEGVLSDFAEFYDDADNETDALAPAAVTGASYDGVKYGVPLSYSNIMMYANLDILSAAGIDAPPTTWEEFEAMIPALTKDENGDGTPEQYAIALADHATLATYPVFLWNGGGGIVSEDGETSQLGDPATIETLEYWVDLVVNQKASPVGLNGGDADSLFLSGKAAFQIVGPWMTTGFDEAGINYEVVRPFAGPEDDAVLAITVAATVPASVDDETRAAAFEFLQFLNSKESQTTWAVGSGFPPNRTDLTEADLSESKWSAAFGDPEVSENARLFLPGIADASEINDNVFVPALQRALAGEGSVEEIFTEASQQVQDILDR